MNDTRGNDASAANDGDRCPRCGGELDATIASFYAGPRPVEELCSRCLTGHEPGHLDLPEPDPGVQPAASVAPSAGWFPETATPGVLRWWDGERWTDHRVVHASRSGKRSNPLLTLGMVLIIAGPLLCVGFGVLGALTINPCGAFGDGCEDTGGSTGFGQAMFMLSALSALACVGGIVALVIGLSRRRRA